MKWLLALAFVWGTSSGVLAAWAPTNPTPEKGHHLYSDSDFWADLTIGYSFCTLDDLKNSTTAWNAYYGSVADVDSRMNNDGVDLNLDGGFLLDDTNGLALGLEAVQIGQISYSAATSSASSLQVIQPNVYSATLNLCRFFDQKPDHQTYIIAGIGYYYGVEGYSRSDYSSGHVLQSIAGDWNGGTLGGTLGAGARLNVTPHFGVQFEARARYANISKVDTVYSVTSGSTTTTILSALAVNPQGLIVQEPEGNVGANGNQDRFLNFDFSGFHLNIGVFYNF